MKRYGSMLVVTLAVCLASSALAVPAGAQEATPEEEARKTEFGMSFALGAGLATFDDFDTTEFVWRVQAAYSPCRWVAAELEWLDLGSPTNTFPSGARVEMATGGFNLSIVPTVPINDQWAVFGKLGGYFWDANFKGVDGGNWSTDLSFGAGVNYKLFQKIGAGLKAEWTHVMLEVGEKTFQDGTVPSFQDPVDVFTVGAYVLF